MKGGGEKITVAIVAARKDYQGPINVELRNLPIHVRATKAVIQSGQNRATIQVHADAKAIKIDKLDVFALGTATLANNKQIPSGNVLVSVSPKPTKIKPKMDKKGEAFERGPSHNEDDSRRGGTSLGLGRPPNCPCGIVTDPSA